MNPPRRIASVDIVRGLMMALMMIDHVREFFFLHRQVSDPVDLKAAGMALFFTRWASHICAPAFVLLAGLSVAIRKDRRGDGSLETARYLVRRGLLLVLLEITVVNFAWTFQFPPTMVYLQVIWAIGLSMIALAGLIFLPPGILLASSLLIVLGHDLLTPISPTAGGPGFIAWSILHDRSLIPISDTITLRTSYPVLPYIGVIGLGYSMGRLYIGSRDPRARRTWLLTAGTGSILLFLVLRPLGIYGEPGPFIPGDSALETLASFLNTTKYPPSPLFLLMTLGPTLILLAIAERLEGKLPGTLARFGAAPMIYYLLHLYVLHVTNLVIARATGTTGLFRFDRVASVWIATAFFLAVVCPATLLLAKNVKRSTGSHSSRVGSSPSPTPPGFDSRDRTTVPDRN